MTTDELRKRGLMDAPVEVRRSPFCKSKWAIFTVGKVLTLDGYPRKYGHYATKREALLVAASRPGSLSSPWQRWTPNHVRHRTSR